MILLSSLLKYITWRLLALYWPDTALNQIQILDILANIGGSKLQTRFTDVEMYFITLMQYPGDRIFILNISMIEKKEINTVLIHV